MKIILFIIVFNFSLAFSAEKSVDVTFEHYIKLTSKFETFTTHCENKKCQLTFKINDQPQKDVILSEDKVMPLIYDFDKHHQYKKTAFDPKNPIPFRWSISYKNKESKGSKLDESVLKLERRLRHLLEIFEEKKK